MNNQVSRIESIAITILYRYYKNCKIDFSTIYPFDLIISNQESDFRFAVSVRRTTYAETESYFLAMEDIMSYNNIKGKYRIPYAIMFVNEAKESAKIGIVIDWYNSTPIINQKVSLKEITEKSWGKIYNQILCLDKTIRSLPNVSWKVIKRITVKNNQIVLGEIMYLRDFSPNYKMSSPTVRSEQEKWNIFLNGIPQDEYPNDQLDDLILKKIKEMYPQTNGFNSALLLFNVELRDLKKKYGNYYLHSFNILVEPKWDEYFSQSSPNPFFMQKLNKQIRIPLDMYVVPTVQNMNVLPQDYIESVDLQHWYDDYFTYSKAKESIHSLTDMIDIIQ